jgi:hypothetical protein
MSRYQGPDPYGEDDYSHPPQRGYYGGRRPRRGDDGAEALANIVHTIVTVIAGLFILHILFVVLDANEGNSFVSFVYSAAKVFVLGFGDVFTPRDATVGVVLNYGFAALIYIVIGQLIIKLLRR